MEGEMKVHTYVCMQFFAMFEHVHMLIPYNLQMLVSQDEEHIL